MRQIEDIITELRSLRPALTKRYPIREIGVFGSFARGEQTEASDIDILVEFGGSIGLIEFSGLQQDLSDALGVKVDLILKDALKPRIEKRVLSEVVMV